MRAHMSYAILHTFIRRSTTRSSLPWSVTKWRASVPMNTTTPVHAHVRARVHKGVKERSVLPPCEERIDTHTYVYLL